jgi:hypothetical protein
MVWKFAAMLFWSQRQISNENYTLVFRPRFAKENTMKPRRARRFTKDFIATALPSGDFVSLMVEVFRSIY